VSPTPGHSAYETAHLIFPDRAADTGGKQDQLTLLQHFADMPAGRQESEALRDGTPIATPTLF
jgi:hypothetical protein